jgi:predicted DNA binding CopG/RHH family protein
MSRFDRVQTHASTPDEAQAAHTERSLTVRLEGFAWEAISEEAAREGLTTEELIGFAVLYYLADSDSGRISRQVSRRPISRR